MGLGAVGLLSYPRSKGMDCRPVQTHGGGSGRGWGWKDSSQDEWKIYQSSPASFPYKSVGKEVCGLVRGTDETFVFLRPESSFLSWAAASTLPKAGGAPGGFRLSRFLRGPDSGFHGQPPPDAFGRSRCRTARLPSGADAAVGIREFVRGEGRPVPG